MVVGAGLMALAPYSVAASVTSGKDAATPDPAESPVMDAGPALWRVTAGDTKARTDFYLFANIHALDAHNDGLVEDRAEDLFEDPDAPDQQASTPSWQSPALEAALSAAEVVWLEADMSGTTATEDATRALQEFGDNPPGITLSERLGDDASLISPAAAAIGAPPQAFEPMRPWKAHLILNLELLRQSGMLPEEDPGAVIRRESDAAGREVDFFETSAAQFAILTDLDAKTEESLLSATLQTFEEIRDSLPTLAGAWRAGDMEAVDILMNEPLRRRAPLAYDALVVQRNQAWVERIEKIARGKKTAFIVLGARHLAGPDSVVAMLREAGFEVTPVQGAAVQGAAANPE